MPEAKKFDVADWEKEIRRVYSVPGNTTAAEGIIALQHKLGWITEDKTETYRAKWAQIREVLADSPTPDEIVDMLSAVGLPMEEFYDMYDEDKIADALRYAKDLKDRYTVLWLAEQIR
jgi:glycerol-1-phosphate dehydrogenase [NAD(P)+]